MSVTERPVPVDPDVRVSDHLPAATPVADDPVEQRQLVRKARWRRWRARLTFLVVLIECVAIGWVQADARLERRDQVQLQGAVLSADPIDIISTSPGNVVEALVRPGGQVSSGDAVAVVDAVRPAPAGGEQLLRTTLVAPVDGVVSAVPAKGGAALRSGDVVVRLYRPETLHLAVDVDLDRATDLQLGMVGRFRARGVDPIDVTLVGIEPAMTSDPGERPQAELQLQPIDADVVRPLLVGLAFDGWLTEGSAPDADQG